MFTVFISFLPLVCHNALFSILSALFVTNDIIINVVFIISINNYLYFSCSITIVILTFHFLIIITFRYYHLIFCFVFFFSFDRPFFLFSTLQNPFSCGSTLAHSKKQKLIFFFFCSFLSHHLLNVDT